MAGIGKQFKGSGIAKSGFSSKHEQARDHLKSGGLTPIGNLRIPRRVKGELNMLAEGGRAHYAEGSEEKPKPIKPIKLPSEELDKAWEEFQDKFGYVVGPEKKAKGGWIKSAIKHPGALRASLHVKAGEKIPAKKLAAAAKKPGTMGRRARLAQTLKGFKK